MELSEWASVSEMVASVVIIASLGYVAPELNQNTQAIQQSSYQDALDTLSSSDYLLASDSEVHRIVKLGEVDAIAAVVTLETQPDLLPRRQLKAVLGA